MSGEGWAIVGKSNKKPNVPVKKLTKTEKQKFVESAPRLEDILPLDQIQSLYTPLDKENRKPQTNKATIVKENEVKKPKKKVAEKKKEPVRVVPKTYDIAARALDLQELVAVVELNQARFPDVPLLWLKGLAEYLNARLTHTGSVALPRPKDSYLAPLPGPVRDALVKAIKQTSQSARQHYFEHSLTTMVNDMSRGIISITGYKVLLQLIVAQSAGNIVADFSKILSLRNSYQNNQSIGLTILWAVGQLGIKDVPSGLNVWQQLMAPMLEMKNYSNFVISYLNDICTVPQRSKPPSTDQLMAVLDTVYSPNLNIPVNSRQELYDATSVLMMRTMEFEPSTRMHQMFQPLLQRLTPLTAKPLKEKLLSNLVLCLETDVESYSMWRQLYEKNTVSSAILLAHLSVGEWAKLNAAHFRDTLITFQATNQELLKGKQRGDTVKNCQTACEDLIEKMTITRSFPWRFGSFLLLLSIAGLLAFDVQKHGSFKASSTGRLLQDVGALKYGEQAWVRTKYYSGKSYDWASENVPVYYREASERAGPYLQQVKETVIVIGSHANQTYWNAYSYVQEKAPIVEAWVNHYAPGLINTVQTQSVKIWGLTKEYTVLALEIVVKQSYSAFDWAKTNIFVGNLSPEKLQQYSKEAINTTQVYAAWTYDWVREKMHTFSKVQ